MKRGIVLMFAVAGMVQAQELERVGRVATVMVDGDVCQRIQTAKSARSMLQKDPRDPWDQEHRERHRGHPGEVERAERPSHGAPVAAGTDVALHERPEGGGHPAGHHGAREDAPESHRRHHARRELDEQERRKDVPGRDGGREPPHHASASPGHQDVDHGGAQLEEEVVAGLEAEVVAGDEEEGGPDEAAPQRVDEGEHPDRPERVECSGSIACYDLRSRQYRHRTDSCWSSCQRSCNNGRRTGTS